MKLNSRSLFVLAFFLIAIIVLAIYLIKFIYKPAEGPFNEEHLKLGKCDGTLTILYDNNPYDPKLRTAWGFSCLVSLDGATILFDTGGDGRLLAENMAKLGVDIRSIQAVVLSHIHGDHTGGLDAVLEKNNNVTVFLPASFTSNFKADVKRHGSAVVEVYEAVKVHDCVATTGVLGRAIEEQSLMVETSRGLVLVTGCAHPGIVNIVRRAKELTGEEIHLVVGGFHLASKSEEEINRIITQMKELGVRKVAPCHCSGDPARRLFKEAFIANYIEAGVGKVIQIVG